MKPAGLNANPRENTSCINTKGSGEFVIVHINFFFFLLNCLYFLRSHMLPMFLGGFLNILESESLTQWKEGMEKNCMDTVLLRTAIDDLTQV